jgi:hypothetical protein
VDTFQHVEAIKRVDFAVRHHAKRIGTIPVAGADHRHIDKSPRRSSGPQSRSWIAQANDAGFQGIDKLDIVLRPVECTSRAESGPSGPLQSNGSRISHISVTGMYQVALGSDSCTDRPFMQRSSPNGYVRQLRATLKGAPCDEPCHRTIHLHKSTASAETTVPAGARTCYAAMVPTGMLIKAVLDRVELTHKQRRR